MTYTPRTAEETAPATLADLIPQLTKLTTGEPTTVEIQEAHRTSKAVTRLLVEWLAERYYNKPRVNGNDAMRAIAAEQIANPEEDAEFEKLAQETARAREAQRIEALKPEVFDIVNFAGNILGIQKGA